MNEGFNPADYLKIDVHSKEVLSRFFYNYQNFINNHPEDFELVPTEHRDPDAYMADIITMTFAMNFVEVLEEQIEASEALIREEVEDQLEDFSMERVQEVLATLNVSALIMQYSAGKARVEKGTNECTPDDIMKQVLKLQEQAPGIAEGSAREFEGTIMKTMGRYVYPRMRGLQMHRPEMFKDAELSQVCVGSCESFSKFLRQVISKSVQSAMVNHH